MLSSPSLLFTITFLWNKKCWQSVLFSIKFFKEILTNWLTPSLPQFVHPQSWEKGHKRQLNYPTAKCPTVNCWTAQPQIMQRLFAFHWYMVSQGNITDLWGFLHTVVFVGYGLWNNDFPMHMWNVTSGLWRFPVTRERLFWSLHIRGNWVHNGKS